jgi:hypothetical protein
MPSSSDHVSTPARPRATVLGAYIEGWRRTLRAPGVTFGVWVLTVVVSAPLAFLLHDAIASHLGSSTMSEQVIDGWNQDWAGEFASEADGVASTFTHEILGATGMVATLSRLFDGQPPPAPLLGAVALFVVGSIFLSGGIVDRLARARPVGFAAFLGLCGGYFFRLLRLAICAGLAYWLLFRTVHPWLFGAGGLFDRLTRDLANEPQGLAIRAGLYTIFALLLGLVSLVTDFTRVRLVVEDRRSVIAAIAAAIRFIRRRFWRCSGLYALNIAGQVVLARVWLQVAAGADGSDAAALLVAQAYLVARIWARMAFLGSETVFHQGELAHATYTAAPVPRWPDSASVEAIGNLRRS